MKRFAIVAAVVGVGAYALAWYGRSRTRAELATFGTEAGPIASSMSFTEALSAGARAVVGRPALPQLVVTQGVN